MQKLWVTLAGCLCALHALASHPKTSSETPRAEGAACARVSLPAKSCAGIKLEPENIRFVYGSAEEGPLLSCQHAFFNELGQDWAVKCADEMGRSRKYDVHLWVTAYERDHVPHVSYEVLYWVTDKSAPATNAYSSSTLWFHLKDKSEMHMMELKQYLENDMRYLEVQIRP